MMHTTDSHLLSRKITRRFFATGIGLAVAGLGARLPLYAQSGRWLEVRRLSGSVTYRGGSVRAARTGDRLTQGGHGLYTSSGSSAVLSIDGSVGTVTVAENTRFSVQQLGITADGAYVTILSVTQGQVRVQAQPFTNPNTRLELHTPSGVSAVRGTKFGVSISSNGKNGIGTLEGSVDFSAQGESVQVGAGFASIALPGEAPIQPIPLGRELALNLTHFDRRGPSLHVHGQINAANTLLIGDHEVEIDRSGAFTAVFPVSQIYWVMTFKVRNPLGEERQHRVPLRQR